MNEPHTPVVDLSDPHALRSASWVRINQYSSSLLFHNHHTLRVETLLVFGVFFRPGCHFAIYNYYYIRSVTPRETILESTVPSGCPSPILLLLLAPLSR